MTYAEHEFTLSERQSDGSTLRQNLEAVARNTGFVPKELESPCEMPNTCMHVWHWFLNLNSQRTSNGFGVNPITNADMWFYFQLEQVEPESWELDLIRRFDQVAMEKMQKQQEKANKKK